jgi:hypothetical protein
LCSCTCWVGLDNHSLWALILQCFVFRFLRRPSKVQASIFSVFIDSLRPLHGTTTPNYCIMTKC